MLAQLLSHVQLFETLCSLSGSSVRGILRQECWSRLPCPPPGDLPNLGIEPTSPWLLPCQADSLPPGNPLHMVVKLILFMKSFMENLSVPSCSLKLSHYRGKILCDFPYMQNLKNDTNELIYGIETHRFGERTYDCQWERKGGRDS